MRDSVERIAHSLRTSQTLRLLSIAFLALLLQIPVSRISELVRERQQRRDAAIGEVASKWGNAQSITGPVLSARVPPACTSTVSGAHENGALGPSKNFRQRVSTSAGPRRGLSASQMTSGAIMLSNFFTSRSARVFAKAVSVARTCSVSSARDSAA